MPAQVLEYNPDGSPRFAVWRKSDPDPENPLHALIALGVLSPSVFHVAPSFASRVIPREDDGQPPAPAPPPPPTPVETVPVVERLNLLVFSCDYRGPRLDCRGQKNPAEPCGCGQTWLCGLGRGSYRPHEAGKADCYRCVTGQLDATKMETNKNSS